MTADTEIFSMNQPLVGILRALLYLMVILATGYGIVGDVYGAESQPSDSATLLHSLRLLTSSEVQWNPSYLEKILAVKLLATRSHPLQPDIHDLFVIYESKGAIGSTISDSQLLAYSDGKRIYTLSINTKVVCINMDEAFKYFPQLSAAPPTDAPGTMLDVSLGSPISAHISFQFLDNKCASVVRLFQAGQGNHE